MALQKEKGDLAHVTVPWGLWRKRNGTAKREGHLTRPLVGQISEVLISPAYARWLANGRAVGRAGIVVEEAGLRKHIKVYQRR